MEDRPSLTRWSFEDFKLFYDVRFGRKRSSKGEAEEDASSGSRHGGIRANGMVTANGSVKRSSDLAVYEQFERQVGGSHPRFSSCVHVVIYRDIVRGSPDVKWESIKGLENAKRLLKEAVVMPIKYPK
ncbi:hypothetical protein BHM03_00022662 [Ensete ventricosum]|nr:hypothetical protein BHM03_00022662 [Ensete ventricosum]